MHSGATNPAGSYSVTGDRGSATGCFPARAELHAGWFNETAGPFARRVEDDGDALALLHVDCDLYSSARDCLRSLAPLFQRGSVVLFDDFLAHETWRDDEKRAWDEAIEENGLRGGRVAASLLSGPAASAWWVRTGLSLETYSSIWLISTRTRRWVSLSPSMSLTTSMSTTCVPHINQ